MAEHGKIQHTLRVTPPKRRLRKTASLSAALPRTARSCWITKRCRGSTPASTVAVKITTSSTFPIKQYPYAQRPPFGSAEKTDVLADGDTIQIGPFTIAVALEKDVVTLTVQGQVLVPVPVRSVDAKPEAANGPAGAGDVLKVFWEKRTREKEDWGTRLRPTEKPKPGKAMFNWKPTQRSEKTVAIRFVHMGVFAGRSDAVRRVFSSSGNLRSKPLSSPHAARVKNSVIAVASNGNSCTTCHTPNEPIENSCVRCHSAAQFHASNTKAHEQAGITCTACHQEHRGSRF